MEKEHYPEKGQCEKVGQNGNYKIKDISCIYKDDKAKIKAT